MKKILLAITTLLTINLHAYIDNDMDGVDDAFDKCPNTLFTDLVDINGCSKESLVSPHRYDVIVGVSYSDSDFNTLDATDTFASSLQVDYYYKQFSLQASTSYFKTDADDYSDSGLYDSYLGGSYRLNSVNNLSISLSAGIILPTYDTELDNNNMDYTASVNLSYTHEDMNIFGGYALTLVNDDDIGDIRYQNTNALNAGLGYNLSNKLYMSASYSVSDSIYRGLEDVETATVYSYYTIDQERFLTASYSYGLSDTASDNYLSLRLGFLF